MKRSKRDGGEAEALADFFMGQSLCRLPRPWRGLDCSCRLTGQVVIGESPTDNPTEYLLKPLSVGALTSIPILSKSADRPVG